MSPNLTAKGGGCFGLYSLQSTVYRCITLWCTTKGLLDPLTRKVVWQFWPEMEKPWHTASFGCHCKCISKENNLNFSQNESFIKKLVNLNLECWAGLGIRSSVFWANRLFFSKNEQIMSFEHFAFTKAYNNNSYQCFGWLSGHVSP